MSRGGHKLEAALVRFGVDLAGLRVIDVGASTGGFTDAALQAGAASVVALDVGRGQLHQRLMADDRVTNKERTTVRRVDPESLGGPADAVTGDLSFISLSAVAPDLLRLARPGAPLVLLVKPQFEATRPEVDQAAGVIRDPRIWLRTVSEVCGTFQGLGAAIMGVMTSPLRGADGNVEFLVHLIAPPCSPSPVTAADLVQAAVAEAEAGV